MRHITRTHGVNVSWLHDLYKKKAFVVVYTRTEAMCSGMCITCFRELLKWLREMAAVTK